YYNCCAFTWHLFRRSLYFFSHETQTWLTAKKICEDKDAGLVNIKSGEEQVSRRSERMTGLRKIHCLYLNCYKFLNFFTLRFWDTSAGQPNTDKGKEDCVTLTWICPLQQCWHDFPCTMAHRYICKMGPKREWYD
uniref:C-type lectin domain-containing protein n=1 Tax=Salvator merianae TaxID=96440 RepID=A0A8D0B6M8_SALMN